MKAPKASSYSEQELAVLRRLYRLGSKEELLEALPGRLWKSISMQAYRIGLKRVRTHAVVWTDVEDQQLRVHYPTKSARLVASLIGRSQSAVNHRAELLGVRAEGRRSEVSDYTPEERAAICSLYALGSQEDLLAALPGRNWKSIQAMANRLGMRRLVQQTYCWSAEHDELLRQHYPEKGAAYVGSLTNRSQSQVRDRAWRLGVTTTYWKVRRPKPKEVVARELRLTKLVQAEKKVKEKKAKKKPVVAAKPKKEVAQPIVAPKPVKRSPATPNLNAHKAAVKAAATPKPSQYVTAAEVRALPAGHKARMAWTRAAYHGPAAATQAFHEAMKSAA